MGHLSLYDMVITGMGRPSSTVVQVRYSTLRGSWGGAFHSVISNNCFSRVV